MQLVLGQARPGMGARNPGRWHQGGSVLATDKHPGEQREHGVEIQGTDISRGPRRCLASASSGNTAQGHNRSWDSEQEATPWEDCWEQSFWQKRKGTALSSGPLRDSFSTKHFHTLVWLTAWCLNDIKLPPTYLRTRANSVFSWDPAHCSSRVSLDTCLLDWTERDYELYLPTDITARLSVFTGDSWCPVPYTVYLKKPEY